MIVFNLKCANDHIFEAWFRSSEVFSAQQENGEVACPTCANNKIEKLIAAPRLNMGRGVQISAQEMKGETVELLRNLKKAIEENCDYVGNRFAEEARKIHYGETEARGIYGEVTKDEAKELKEEGVEAHPIPWASRQDS